MSSIWSFVLFLYSFHTFVIWKNEGNKRNDRIHNTRETNVRVFAMMTFTWFPRFFNHIFPLRHIFPIPQHGLTCYGLTCFLVPTQDQRKTEISSNKIISDLSPNLFNSACNLVININMKLPVRWCPVENIRKFNILRVIRTFKEIQHENLFFRSFHTSWNEMIFVENKVSIIGVLTTCSYCARIDGTLWT